MNNTKNKQNNSLVIQLRDAIIEPKADRKKFGTLDLNIFILGRKKDCMLRVQSPTGNVNKLLLANDISVFCTKL